MLNDPRSGAIFPLFMTGDQLWVAQVCSRQELVSLVTSDQLWVARVCSRHAVSHPGLLETRTSFPSDQWPAVSRTGLYEAINDVHLVAIISWMYIWRPSNH